MAYNNYRYARWLRHPKTTQERRASFDDNGRPRLGRPRRNFHNMIQLCDDVPVEELRNWKKHRRTQYYVIDM